ncbi:MULTISPECIES: ribbon-helix-helix domain-containing protein [Thiorhodovibrio]|uniref:ribbon-helix-helix domain-containing protein n=1 Tax=Thiorhodovibrio TaxID=61593 RepID=UPI001913F88C|nr:MULTISPECIES: CopG family transcriptional regulator [Thiorhodovibrio]MBK5968304.1 toxin-antitoxin system HicB family antitoxin [Thiorhodovibrio winogradskyi]WPL15023.1 Ribbon-helix-helix protein, copG family [Thiorhodovibrio litoralis]
MTTLTIHLPDDTAARLDSLARSRGLTTNKLVEDLSARALAAWDTENHFRAMAATGDIKQALKILDRLDDEDRQAGADLSSEMPETAD